MRCSLARIAHSSVEPRTAGLKSAPHSGLLNLVTGLGPRALKHTPQAAELLSLVRTGRARTVDRRSSFKGRFAFYWQRERKTLFLCLAPIRPRCGRLEPGLYGGRSRAQHRFRDTPQPCATA